jgi:homoserine dehydrogenase
MLDVAILGLGTVGSGVLEVIEKNADAISQSAAQEIRVKYILARRDYPGAPFERLVTKDFSVIENDPDVRVVIETIGGIGAAYEYTKRSLMKGKSVVTANKELVATHGYELTQLARANDVNYLFEASVGGGIPIIRPLSQCLAANKIKEIYGILNGTTNFILTEMIRNGLSFETALKRAQEQGYAEANPDADVKGYDVCRKICILSALSFGRHVYPHQVKTEGIESVTLADIGYAEQLGCRIKLLGRAIHREEDGKISAYVAPHLVHENNLIASVEGVMNGIIVRGNAIGDVMFYGAGAGKLPTASAVVADVIDAAKHITARKWLSWEDGSDDIIYDSALLESAWYVRAAVPKEGIAKRFGDVRTIEGAGEIVFVTPVMNKFALSEKLDGMDIKAAFRILK